jgi:hypothetical protein
MAGNFVGLFGVRISPDGAFGYFRNNQDKTFEMMEQSIKVMTVAVLSTLFSFLIDNEEMLFRAARWLPVILGTGFTIWQWYKAYKNNK